MAPIATSLSSTLEQQPLFNRLTEPQLIPTDNDMLINEPAKPVAGLSKQTSWQPRICCWQWIVILVHSPITKNGEWDLPLAGEDVIYIIK